MDIAGYASAIASANVFLKGWQMSKPSSLQAESLQVPSTAKRGFGCSHAIHLLSFPTCWGYRKRTGLDHVTPFLQKAELCWKTSWAIECWWLADIFRKIQGGHSYGALLRLCGHQQGHARKARRFGSPRYRVLTSVALFASRFYGISAICFAWRGESPILPLVTRLYKALSWCLSIRPSTLTSMAARGSSSAASQRVKPEIAGQKTVLWIW